MAEIPGFIEFAPHHKTVNAKPGMHGTPGTFWYALGWVNGTAFEFATQESKGAAELLCYRLNLVAQAVSSMKARVDEA